MKSILDNIEQFLNLYLSFTEHDHRKNYDDIIKRNGTVTMNEVHGGYTFMYNDYIIRVRHNELLIGDGNEWFFRSACKNTTQFISYRGLIPAEKGQQSIKGYRWTDYTTYPISENEMNEEGFFNLMLSSSIKFPVTPDTIIKVLKQVNKVTDFPLVM